MTVTRRLRTRRLRNGHTTATRRSHNWSTTHGRLDRFDRFGRFDSQAPLLEEIDKEIADAVLHIEPTCLRGECFKRQLGRVIRSQTRTEATACVTV